MQKISKLKTAMTYATAWFDAAKENKKEDEVFTEVKALLTDIEQNPDIWSKLFMPVDDIGSILSIVNSMTKALNFSDISKQALYLITENRKLKILKNILMAFTELYYQDKKIINVTVESAVELSKAQDEKLKERLEYKLQAKVYLDYIINPDVLGGLKICYQSFMIDDTLKTKLLRVQELLRAK